MSVIATPATSGTVASVALTVPTWLSVAGSPITTSGTLAVTAATGQAANTFLATPDGTTGAATLRAIVAGDISGLSLSVFAVPSADLSIGTHKLTNVVDPASPQDAATKNYVDLAVANLVSKADCAAATTTALAASTYNNGSSGVGATISLTVAAVLVLDGYTPALNDRLLIKNQAAPAQNGIFSLTQVGVLGVTQAVLTRTTDFDQPAEVDGAITFISNGSTNVGTRWQCLASGTVVFGTTAINWSTFAGSTYTADETTLHLSGTTFSILSTYSGQSSLVTVGALSAGSLAAGFTVVGAALGGTGIANNAASTISISGNFGTTFTVAATTALTLPASGIVYSTSNFPTDYISGCLIQYVSTTVIQIGTGSAYNPIDSTVTTIASAITNTPTLAASTMYYVYLATGGTTLVVSSTAPTTNYQGTAWKDASNRRYLGCFLTDASSHIFNFKRVGNRQYYKVLTNASPFRVLTAGTSTSAASVSCSGVVPPTCQIVILNVANQGNQIVAIGTSDGVTPSASGGSTVIGQGATIFETQTFDTPLNTSQALTYCYEAAVSGGGVYLDVVGFMEDR